MRCRTYSLGHVKWLQRGQNSIQGSTGASIISLSPSGVVLGAGDFTITVTASTFNGFKSKTVVQWNEKTLVSTPINSSDDNSDSASGS